MPRKAAIEKRIQRVKQSTQCLNRPGNNPRTRNFEIPPTYGDILLHDTGVDDPNRILAFGLPELVAHLGRPESIFWRRNI